MVRVLCNLALDGFDHRARFANAGIELLTFGPGDHDARSVDFGGDYPFDIEFDAGRESWHDLQARLPRDFAPDVLLIYWPEQEPIPRDLEHCPVPVVGVMSDYNIALHLTAGLWPFFDVLLCDSGGLEVYRELGFEDVRHFVQFSQKTSIHRLIDGVPRDVDVAFAGNHNPLIQGERASFLQRIRDLGAVGVQSEIVGGVRGSAYGHLLNRAKIGFNRSVRGEMNLRGFEVPACGAVLLMESSNREVRDFFEPGEECVLYDDDTLEETVLALLKDEPRRERIARAGHARVQEHRMPERILAMLDVLEGISIRRGRAGSADRTFGRARALMQTWVDPRRIASALHEAHALAPDDPRPINDLAVTMIRAGTKGGQVDAQRAIDLWNTAMRASPDYVIAPVNCLWLLEAAGMGTERERAAIRDEIDARIDRATCLRDFDGILMPPGCTAPNLAYCTALHDALLQRDLAPLRAHFAATTKSVPV